MKIRLSLAAHNEAKRCVIPGSKSSKHFLKNDVVVNRMIDANMKNGTVSTSIRSIAFFRSLLKMDSKLTHTELLEVFNFIFGEFSNKRGKKRFGLGDHVDEDTHIETKIILELDYDVLEWKKIRAKKTSSAFQEMAA